MEEIIKDKMQFIADNKDIIIDNLGIVGYDLFSILNTDKALNELKEYKKLLNFFSDKKIIINYNTKDEIYILYYLSSFLDKIGIELEEKEKSRAKIFEYIKYFNSKNLDHSIYVKMKKKSA